MVDSAVEQAGVVWRDRMLREQRRRRGFESMRCCVALLVVSLFLATVPPAAADATKTTRIRVATFNVAMNRPRQGALSEELKAKTSRQARQVAEVIQRVRPDVLLINEFDFDEAGAAARRFQLNYLAVGQRGQDPIIFEHQFLDAVNTGEPSGQDLDNDGKRDGPGDAFGFGRFRGQYGMLVLSRFPIARAGVRTFRKFLWQDMPQALLPVTPRGPYYSDAERRLFRLSSKSHWDVPLVMGKTTLHFLCSHPTPPVFDGPEDRNGRRNHDEIRFWADYVVPQQSAYIYDDQGKHGGLPAGARFVVAGDMNADPHDGDSFEHAIEQLLSHDLIDSRFVPQSRGARDKAVRDGGANNQHITPAASDTADFNDRSVGNLRLDYVLPAKTLKVISGGTFWPATDEPGHDLAGASDHHLVWIDIALEN